MARNRKIDAQTAAIELNGIRLNIKGEGITPSALKATLVEKGFPKSQLFWTFFINSGIVVKISKKYHFTNPDTPVYYKDFAKMYGQYIERSKKYASHRKVEVDINDPYVQAIGLLQSAGYEVYDPEGNRIWKI